MALISSANDFIGVFIIAVLCVCAWMFIQQKMENLTYVKSNIDDNEYLVQNTVDKQEAADTIATINQRIEKLIDYMNKHYPDDPRTERLTKNYKPENVCESVRNAKNTSYSVNKGEKVVLCIRSKETQKIEELNTLMFVTIHEMGHLASKTIGHNDEFWKNFKFLLKHSTKIGIYKKVNYSEKPKDYCGIKITDSPLEK